MVKECISKFSKMMKTNVYDTNGERVYWSKIMLLKLDSRPKNFFFKYSYGESSYHKLEMNARQT